MSYWTDCRDFFQEFRRQYFHTGSILPSSRALARALTSQLRRSRGRVRRILEIGPGTGAVTVDILQCLRPGDHLDIVEINARFIAVLERRFSQEPRFQRHRQRVRLIHAPLQEVSGTGQYDFMISGLPLNNFPVALVRDIFDAYRRLLKPGGTLSYFEYLLIRSIKRALVGAKDKKRLHVLERMLQRRIKAYQIDEQWVFANVPPAVARHLCFARAGTSSEPGASAMGRVITRR